MTKSANLLTTCKTILTQAIKKAPGEKPSFVTSRNHFSWTAFTNELSQHLEKELSTSDIRSQTSDLLQPLITNLISIIQKDQRKKRVENYKEYLEANSKEIKRIRDKYIQAHKEQIRRKQSELEKSVEINYQSQLTSIKKKPSQRKINVPQLTNQEKELHRWHKQVQPVEKALQNAIGELYGSGIIPEFLSRSGRVNWNIFSRITNLTTATARKIAENECRYLLMELQETIISYQDWYQKWIAANRLGF